jgi:hypothetical protein
VNSVAQRTCLHCECSLPSGAPYFRVAVALQGESEVLAPTDGGSTDPEELLKQLDHLDEAELEAGVHEELGGVLCPSCRAQLRAFFGVRSRVQ